MSLLIENGRPAELRRGLQFIERFNSSSQVLANGGSVFGGVTFNNEVATFDGVSGSYIQYTNMPKWYNETTGFTFLARVKSNEISVGGYARIFRDVNSAFILGVFNSAGTMLIQGGVKRFDGIPKAFQYNLTPTWGDTFEIALRYDVTVGIEAFVNGVSIGTTASALDLWAWDDAIMRFGTYLGTLEMWDGTIEKPRFFNTPLTDSEILAYANGSMCKYRRKEIFHTVADRIGSVIDLIPGTIYTQPVGANQPAIVKGYNDLASLSHDGNDYIPVNDAGLNSLNDNFTIIQSVSKLDTTWAFKGLLKKGLLVAPNISWHLQYNNATPRQYYLRCDTTGTHSQVVNLGIYGPDLLNRNTIGVVIRGAGRIDSYLGGESKNYNVAYNFGTGLANNEDLFLGSNGVFVGQHTVFFNIPLNQMQMIDFNLYLNEFILPTPDKELYSVGIVEDTTMFKDILLHDNCVAVTAGTLADAIAMQKAIRFNGTTNYYSYGDLGEHDELTFSVWVNNTNLGNDECIFDTSVGWGGVQTSLYFNYNNVTKSYHLFVKSGGGISIDINTNVTEALIIGKWWRLTLKYNRITKNYEIWYNNILNTSGNTVAQPGVSWLSSFSIGTGVTGTYYFEGDLYLPKLAFTKLPALQISSDYKLEIQGMY